MARPGPSDWLHRRLQAHCFKLKGTHGPHHWSCFFATPRIPLRFRGETALRMTLQGVRRSGLDWELRFGASALGSLRGGCGRTRTEAMEHGCGAVWGAPFERKDDRREKHGVFSSTTQWFSGSMSPIYPYHIHPSTCSFGWIPGVLTNLKP